MGLRISISFFAFYALVFSQIYRPPAPIAKPQLPAVRTAPDGPVPDDRLEPPPAGIVMVYAIVQEREGEKFRLRQNARLETYEMRLEADEIDYDRELGVAEARGSVKYRNFISGESMLADRVDYNLNRETATFYKVSGSAFGKIDPRPGILTTGNPFLFHGDWAEKLKDRYLLHNGTITNCDDRQPWWTLTSSLIDIIPNQRALAYKSMMRMKRVPVLWAPVFYKDLSGKARKSGFLTPNFGNSNRRGQMFGLGYFWAINRSYDLMYRPQYFTTRGFAHTFDFRGNPTQTSDFNFYFYGVNDKGLPQDDGTRRKEGGYLLNVTGKAQLRYGFYARGVINYLSNFRFRQSFTESFNEAIYSESNSNVNVSKDWSTYHLNLVFSRLENFQSTEPGDTILVRKLPQLEFDSRDREINRKVIPIWVSWSSSAGLLRRTQPLFQTRQFVERLDVEPRVLTAFHWKNVHLVPSFAIRDTYYGASFRNPLEQTSGQVVSGDNVNRFSREFRTDVIFPTLERTFSAPKWIGSKLKHSIEPRANVRLVAGSGVTRNIIRFDEMDILTNTSEVEFSLANRLWAKSRSGEVWDWMTLEVRQRRYLDPEFGGNVVDARRNVFLATSDLTGFAFLDRARRYSPVVSSLRAAPRPGFGLEWRADYDPLRGKFTNSTLTADARIDNYFFSVGHSKISCVPLGEVPAGVTKPCVDYTDPPIQTLSPSTNQIRMMVGIGNESKRGWNAGFLSVYDYTTRTMQFGNTQITYNTSCCAFSGQYRRFAFGDRNENQFRFAMVIANIGSFGTLKRQERLF